MALRLRRFQTILGATSALALTLPAAASAAECSIDTGAMDPGNVPALVDGSGAVFDVSLEEKAAPADDAELDFATLNQGETVAPAPRLTDDSWDGWGALFVGPGGDASLANSYFNANDDSCAREDGNRELVFPAQTLGGLVVQRKLYVPTAGLPGGRLVQLLSNRTGAPITTAVQIGDTKSDADWGDLGSDDNTAVRASSNGDLTLTPADFWAVTSDHAGIGATNDDPVLAHVIDGPGGPQRIDAAGLSGIDADPEDNLFWRWDNVTVQPGQTLVLVSFEVQQVVDDDEVAEDAQVANTARSYQSAPPSTLFAAMTKSEQAAVANWATPVKCLGKPVTIAGTDARDILIGTKKPDVFWAGGGNDKVKGKKGNDRMCGGPGKDKLLGGPGKKDRAKGGGGKDVEKP